MQEFGGQRTMCGTLARKGKLLAAAVVLSAALTACGGGGDDAPAAAGSRGAQPSPGAAPTGPGGSLTTGPGGSPTAPSGAASPGSGPSNDGGTSTGPGGALAGGGSTSGSGGTQPGDVTTPPSVGEEEGPTGTGSVTLSWLPPTMNDDGSPLELTGYRIYWGPSDEDFTHSVLVENPGLTRYVVEQLSAGTWYFVATALSDDRESEFSNVFSTTIK